ncbi:hypothetical protein JW948_01605 [bacterium]|nr:hypothetical protein [bacterium]
MLLHALLGSFLICRAMCPVPAGEDSTEFVPDSTASVIMSFMRTNPDSLSLIEIDKSDTVLLSNEAISGSDAASDRLAPEYHTDWSWLSLGAVSFADSVMLYDPGAPGADTGDEPDPRYRNPAFCTGPPDCGSGEDRFTALGNGGTLILEFMDNVFFNGPGPDLYFWMPDSLVEEVMVWISQDGIVYRRAGSVSAAFPALDLSAVAEPGAFYHILKIRDDPYQDGTEDRARGADIDAVGAVHTAVIRALPDTMLFSTMQFSLKNGASAVLSALADLIGTFSGCQVLIEVYAGGSGAGDYGLLLSQERAKTIRDFFINDIGMTNVLYRPIGLGNTPYVPEGSRKLRIDGGVIQFIILSR